VDSLGTFLFALLNMSHFSTPTSTAGSRLHTGVSAVFPIVHTPYKHYEFFSFS